MAYEGLFVCFSLGFYLSSFKLVFFTLRIIDDISLSGLVILMNDEAENTSHITNTQITPMGVVDV